MSAGGRSRGRASSQARCARRVKRQVPLGCAHRGCVVRRAKGRGRPGRSPGARVVRPSGAGRASGASRGGAGRSQRGCARRSGRPATRRRGRSPGRGTDPKRQAPARRRRRAAGQRGRRARSAGREGRRARTGRAWGPPKAGGPGEARAAAAPPPTKKSTPRGAAQARGTQGRVARRAGRVVRCTSRDPQAKARRQSFVDREQKTGSLYYTTSS